MDCSQAMAWGACSTTKAAQDADALPGSVDLKWAFRRMTVQLRMLDGTTVDLIYSTNIPSRPAAL